MSLLEDLTSASQELKEVTSGCKVCKWLLTLEDKDRIVAKMHQWYEDGLPNLNLFNLLRRNGLDGSETGLRRHRNNCMGFRDVSS